MRIERVGPPLCVLGDDLAQQPADRLEQYKAISVGRRCTFLLERLGDRGKPRRRNRAEG